VPLKDGMDDTNYQMLYEPIMAKVGCVWWSSAQQQGWCVARMAQPPISWGSARHRQGDVVEVTSRQPGQQQLVLLPLSLAPCPQVMEMFQPSAIVMCCGADSLSGDKLGCFNLSFEGHSSCIEYLAK
jgi:hypothetical protein